MHWRMPRRLWLPGVLFLSIWLVAACQTTAIPTAAIDPDTVCLWDRPISYSSKDSRETVNEIREHNAGWRAICDPRGNIKTKPDKAKTTKAPA